MSFVAVAGGVIVAGAAAYGAHQSSKAAKSANDANLQAARETNQLNYDLFLKSRGSEGSALLPMYLKSGDKTTEQLLAENAQRVYNQARPLSLEEIQRITNQYQPTMTASGDLVRNLFNGELERQQIEKFQPIADARTEGVAARKQAGLESLAAIIGSIEATQAGKGYSGDSYAAKKLRADVTRDVNTKSATDAAATREKNASDLYGIQSAATAAKFANLDQPLQQVQREIDFASAPSSSLARQEAARRQIFDWFRMSPQSFQAAPLPSVQPVASTGQIIGQSVGQLGGALTNYAIDKNRNDQLRGILQEDAFRRNNGL